MERALGLGRKGETVGIRDALLRVGETGELEVMALERGEIDLAAPEGRVVAAFATFLDCGIGLKQKLLWFKAAWILG